MGYDTEINKERWLDVILTAQANFIDPITGADADSDIVVRYAKEGDSAEQTKVMTDSDWHEIGHGLYRIKFSESELDTLGRFTFSVTLDPGHVVAAFLPYYGYVEVISEAESEGYYEVGVGAYYNDGEMKVSMVLHNNGLIVSDPISADIAVYDQAGTLLVNDTSLSPDSQGVFTFTESVTLVEGTVPYVSGIITEVSGIHSGVTLMPVIG